MVTMYDKAAISTGTATMAALPTTGVNTVWLVLAAFALIMAGGALLRIAPRRQS
jgi:LPXTG-motif cell wall-anchored protein